MTCVLLIVEDQPTDLRTAAATALLSGFSDIASLPVSRRTDNVLAV